MVLVIDGQIAENLFEQILRLGHDEDYTPKMAPVPTEHPPGSIGKINEFRRRLENGLELYHPLDAPVLATLEDQMLMAGYVRQEYRHRASEREKCQRSRDHVLALTGKKRKAYIKPKPQRRDAS